MKPRVLVIDDESNWLVVLRELLERAGYEPSLARDPLEALKLAARRAFDAALVDLRLGALDGVETMQRLQRISPELGVIIMTAFATVETAVASLKSGALDYVLKPFDNDALLRAVQRAIALTRLGRDNARLREAARVADAPSSLLGTSSALADVRRLIAQVAPTDATVLLTGETGTGKEVVAREIHAASPRAGQPFVPVHCAALAESVLESELFGHERGAFTGAVAAKRGRFELAAGGTLFLDEIGEISESVQVKLLRALESRSFERVGGEEPLETDARFVAATNREIESEIRAGRFREDLYYRLNVVRIHLPPLRARRDDIPLLAREFLSRYAARLHRPAVRLADAALERLVAYDWPGNVRELQNVIERALVITSGDLIPAESLPPELVRAAGEGAGALRRLADRPLAEALDALERDLILQALEACEYVQARAAEKLGLSKSALHYKLQKHGIKAGA